MPLPSEKYEPGNLTPIGFLHSVPEEHQKSSAAAIEEIAGVVGKASRGKESIRIRISHYSLPPLISPALFGFSIYLFDEKGAWTNDVGPSKDLRYALVLNQS